MKVTVLSLISMPPSLRPNAPWVDLPGLVEREIEADLEVHAADAQGAFPRADVRLRVRGLSDGHGGERQNAEHDRYCFQVVFLHP